MSRPPRRPQRDEHADGIPGAARRWSSATRPSTTVTETVARHRRAQAAPTWLVVLASRSPPASCSSCSARSANLVATGIGVWGLNNPVGWAWDITNFVFWIGIGHAGTLISRHPLPVPAEVAHVASTAPPRR